MGSLNLIRFHQTAADTEALLAGYQTDPTALAATAFERGLLMSSAEVSNFGETFLLAEKARQTMVDAWYKGLQEQIRTPVPLRKTATLPSLGSFPAGSFALPGPQLTMPLGLRDLVVRPTTPAVAGVLVDAIAAEKKTKTC